MKTKNNPNKRQENIINYLNTHGKVSTAELKSTFNIAKSTLSEDIKYLRSIGYPLIKEHNYIALAKAESDMPIAYHEKLSLEIIRKWIILYAMNYYITNTDIWVLHTVLENICTSIYRTLSPNTSAMSKQVFQKDIRELMTLGYISYSDETKNLLTEYKILRKEQKIYVATDKLPKINMLKEDTANLLSTILYSEPYDSIYKSMKSNMLQLFSYKDAEPVHSKHGPLPASSLEILTDLWNQPYKEQCLTLTCNSETLPTEQIIYSDFETGIILFSSETDRFYLLGKAIKENAPQKNYYMVPIDSITGIEALSTRHQLYKNNEIRTAYSHLLSTSLNDGTLNPIAVDFIIINTPQNNKRLNLITKNRPIFTEYSEVEYIELFKPELTMNMDKVKEHGLLRYKDIILGNADLMRLINCFGDELQILEPKSLQNDVKQERQKLKYRYEEAFDLEYKENINECL